MKNFSKSLSVILSITLILSFFSVIGGLHASADINDANIMVNSGFEESDMTNWSNKDSSKYTVTRKNTSITTHILTGSRSLCLANSTASWATVAQYNTKGTNEIGKTYLLSFWAKAYGSDYQFNVKARNAFSSGWTDISVTSNLTAKSNEWLKYTFSFTPSHNYVVFEFSLATGATIYFDNFVLSQNCEMIDDGGFEDIEVLSNNWSKNNISSLNVSNEAYNTGGAQSLKAVGNTSWQTFTYNTRGSVAIGKTYKVSFWAYSTNDGVFNITAKNAGGSSDVSWKEIAKITDTTATSDWKQYSFYMTPGHNWVQMEFGIQANKTIYFDDFSIIEVVDINATAASGGMVTGTGTYTVNEAVSLNAIADSGYKFAGWYKGDTLVSDKNIYTAYATENKTTFVAKFTQSENLIVNGDFEVGNWDWNDTGPKGYSTTNWGKISLVDSNNAFNGDYAIKFTKIENNTNWTGINQTVSVKPNAKYRVTFRYKFDEGSGSQVIFKKDNVNIENLPTYNTNWTLYSYTFTTDADASTVKIEIANQDGSLYIDNLSLVFVPIDGDINGDTNINIIDMLAIKKHLKSATAYNIYYDLDKNTVFDNSDMSALRKSLLGINSNTEDIKYENGRYQYIMDNSGFVYGINEPWFSSSSQGHFLSTDTLNGYAANFNYKEAYDILYNCKQIGFNAVNVWLFHNMSGIQFTTDADGNITGISDLKDDFKANLTSLLEIAKNLDIGLTFTIQPHFDTMAKESYGGNTTKYEEYSKVITDSAVKSAYMSNAVTAALDILKEYENNIVSVIAYVEPELDIYSEAYSYAKANRTQMNNFISEIAELSKTAMPKVPVGVAALGYSVVKEYKALETAKTIDFIGYNHYNTKGNIASSVSGTEGNRFITEGGLKVSNDLSEASRTTNIISYYKNAKAADYKGLYYWSYSSDKTTSLVNDKENTYHNAIGAISNLIKGNETELGEVKILRDDNKLVFLTENSATSYKVYRTDGKSNWTKVADYDSAYNTTGIITAYEESDYGEWYYYVEATDGTNTTKSMLGNIVTK